jgi:hypothetical protein
MSLREALTTLGFDPGYHLGSVAEEEGKDLPTWSRIGDGQ